MAISLKEQLQQKEQIKEISYHAPIFDKNYYDVGDHSQGKESGRRMFYDFYAMEFLWSFLGSGAISRAEREKKIAMDPDDPHRSVISSPSYKHLPDAAVRVIDGMYDQVTHTVAKNLLSYVRLAVVQEFQYLVQYSSGWTGFRNSIVSRYNKNKTITKQDFDDLVNQYIPDMSPYPDVIKRLLKYSKHFSEMHTSDDKDPFDVTRHSTSSTKNEPSVADPESPETPGADAPTDLPPDETDYDAPPTEREFGKYGPDNPSPYNQDWAGNATFNDVPLPKIPSDDDEEEDDLTGGVKERLTEEYINPKKIKKVYAAINKSGITLDDIEKAYNNIPWDGSYGGPKWGAGAVALLKLAHAKKNSSTEDMNHIIDHIYDLQHNTGSLLNKGPMYVNDTDLNRRYKISDIARFIPFVSPVVRNLILRFQKFLRTDPSQAETESNVENLLKSPKIPLEADQITKLGEMGFTPAQDNSYRVAIKFTNKKGEHVSGVYYEIGKYEMGDFDNEGKFQKKEGVTPKFVVADNLRADVRVFNTFEEAYNYLKGYQNDMQPHGYTGVSASTVKSDKDLYIDSHSRIKLPPNKEQELLNINLGWRNKSRYYKAYYTGDYRLLFYAFSDGTFLVAYNNKSSFKTFTEWASAFEYTKGEATSAKEYPEKALAQAEINANASGKTLQPSVAPSQEKEYYLDQDAQDQLTSLLSTDLPQFKHEKYLMVSNSDGTILIKKQKYHVEIPLFSVGQKLGSSLGKPFRVVHYLTTGGPGGPHEAWPFGTWDNTFDFIKQNISQLVNAGLSKPIPLNKQTPQQISPGVVPSLYHGAGTKALPPYSPAQSSYMKHVGIQTPPKHTIRLTKEDEDKLIAIGFEPRMVGEDVWYIHKLSGDTAKFFPNNTAKILFTSKGSAMKVPKVSFTIDKILAWLPTRYSLQTTKSPIDTGAAISSTPPLGMIEKGIKAGTMFEKVIKDAGFDWDDSKLEYKDGNTILKISPNRSSVVTFNITSPDVSPITTIPPEKKYFADLASLITYLKNEYPAQKKSSSITSEKQWPLAPGALTNALKNAKFNYIGPSGIQKTDHGQKSGFIFENPSTNDRVIFYHDATSDVFVNHKNKSLDLEFKNAEELIGWINSYYKALDNMSNQLSEDEMQLAMDKLGEVPNGLSAEKTPVKSVLITKEDGNPFLAVEKVNGHYYLSNFSTPTLKWTTVGNSPNFANINKLLGEYIAAMAKSSDESNTNHLTDEEKIKISKIVSAIPGLKIKDGGNNLMESNGPLQHYVSITNNSGKELFVVRKVLGKYELYKFADYEWKTLYTGNNFGKMLAFLKNTLMDYFKSIKYPSLTDDQVEWIDAYVKTNIPDVKITQNSTTGVLTISDVTNDETLQALFEVSKTKDTPYTVRYFVYDGETDSIKYSLDKHETFEDLAAAIENNIEQYTQLRNYLHKDVKKEQPKSNSITGKSKFVPINDQDAVAKSGFKVTADKENNIIYINSRAGFSFQYYDNGVRWKTKDGIKEVILPPEKAMKFWSDVFSKITAESTHKEIDNIFHNALKTRSGLKFDKLLRSASKDHGIMLSGDAAAQLQMEGFFWDEKLSLYVNDEELQVVSAIQVHFPTNFVNFHLYWISNDGKISKTSTSNFQELLKFIVSNLKNIENIKKLENDQITTPSGESYKTEINFGNAKLITLNNHDTKLLNACGFQFVPSENKYYKNDDGHVFKFFNTGHAEWSNNTGEAGGFADIGNIPAALKFAVSKYISNTNPHVPSATRTDPLTGSQHISDIVSKMKSLGFTQANDGWSKAAFIKIETPLSNETKITHLVHLYSSGNMDYIKLVKMPNIPVQKVKTFETDVPHMMEYLKDLFNVGISFPKLGPSKLTPSDHDYKTVNVDNFQKAIPLNPQDSKIMEYLGFKFTMEFGYPLYIRGETENFAAYNDNTAHYVSGINGEHMFASIKEGLLYLISNSKLPSTSTKDNGKKFPPEIAGKLLEKGFVWDEPSKDYIKNKGKDYEEIIVFHDPEIWYFYLDADDVSKEFKSENPNIILNMIDGIGEKTGKKKLIGYGFKEVSVSHFGPHVKAPPGLTVESEMYKDQTREILQILSNGNVKYGAFTDSGGSSEYIPYTTFQNIEDAVKYFVGSKAAFVQGGLIPAPKDVHDVLINTYHFKYKGSKYQKGNQKIEFYKGGMINYDYTGNMGEKLEWSGTWKVGDIHKFMNKVAELNPEVHSTPNPPPSPTKSEGIRTRAMASLEQELVKLGYKWDEGTMQYVNTSDPLKTLIFMTGGQIYFYTNGHKETTPFKNQEELIDFLSGDSKEKSPFSNFDYVSWGKSTKHNPKATIKLIDADDQLMKDMGYVAEYTDATETPPSSYVYKNKSDGSNMTFHLSGDVIFTSGTGNQISYPSIKHAIEWLWSTHKPKSNVPFDYVNFYKKKGALENQSIQLSPFDENLLSGIGYNLNHLQNTSPSFQFAYANKQKRMFFFANGQAVYWPNEHGATKKFTTIKEAIQFLIDQHNGKSDGMALEPDIVEAITNRLIENGFKPLLFFPDDKTKHFIRRNPKEELSLDISTGKSIYYFEWNGTKFTNTFKMDTPEQIIKMFPKKKVKENFYRTLMEVMFQ